MVEETQHCDGLIMNICLSYGSRGELVHACRSVASDVVAGKLELDDLDEESIQTRLLCQIDPDVVIRTSGEYRISNFLLWQLAYAEMFFLPKAWPELVKEDLLDVIRIFAKGRSRRYGK